MKKTYFSVSFRRYGQTRTFSSHTLLTVILLIAGFGTATLNAQSLCALSCDGAQISLNENCMAEVTYPDIADTSQCLNGNFSVHVLTLAGDTIPTSPFVTEAEIGMTLIASVFDSISGNSCWSYITVEDKLPPQIACNCPPGVPDTLLPPECFVNCIDLDLDLFPGPIVTDNCSNTGEIDVVYTQTVETICDPDYIKRITRRYVATDEYGNQSDTCVQVLYSERIDFGDIVFPDSFSTPTMNPFLCTDDFTDLVGGGPNGNQPDGIPDPIPVAQGGAGVPTVDGIPIYPDFMFYCNAQVTVEDVPIGPFTCVKKVMRMWTVFEWHCMGERDTLYIQLIEVIDEEGPILECPEDITVSTDFHDCDATIQVPIPFAFDSCNSVDNITVDYPGASTQQVTGNMFIDLPVGENVITFTAYDICYNSTQCDWIVTVEDLTPPVPVCDEHTIVSLTNSGPMGLTKVDASVFDDGSYDECGPVTFMARRMNSCINFDWTTNGAGIDEIPNGFTNQFDHGTVFRPKVPFACCDVDAGPIVIELQVTDQSGNVNYCMIEVEVQDKIFPEITCPPDITVSCDFDFDINDLSIFGEVWTNEEDRQEICLFDPENMDDANLEGFTCWGLDGIASDNCDVTVTSFPQFFLDACGTGYILRTFIAEDPGGRTRSCQQRIDVINFDPFYINQANPNDPTDDVIWPQSPYEAFGCGNDVSPEVTGFPQFFEDECDLVGFTYEDQIFPFVQGACFKILRTWEVIDWCQFEPGSGGPSGYVGYWTFTQVIKVMNTDAPTFVTTQPDINECNEFNCDPLFIELIQEGDDDCTEDEDLRWELHYDFDNDETIDLTFTGTGNIINASRLFDIGTHRVIYTFEDGCGNKTTREQLVTVEACVPPTPICLHGLSADLGSDGTVTIWASDFDKGSLHLCGYDVVVSFSQDTNFTSMVFDCDDALLDSVHIQLWVTDVVLGQQDFCTTYIIIQDNMEVCPEEPGGTGIISGIIETEFTATVKNVEVALQGSSQMPVITSIGGSYTFPGMPYGGSYEVKPGKNDDWMNGVSTLDLVKIQKHLLGIELLNSPYKMIAADANKSSSLSAVDILELRKLILGIHNELPNNTSWRFVDEHYQFNDPLNPLTEPFSESYSINPFSTNMIDIDFIGIKVGDVNETVQANAQGVEVRNGRDVFAFHAEDVAFNADEVVELSITAEDFSEMLGYQFTLQFDERSLILQDVVPGALAVSKDFFGMQELTNGMLTTSWSSPLPKAVEPGAVLFTLRFNAVAPGILSSAVNMSSAITNAEAYDATDKIFNLELRFNGTLTTAEHNYALFQNTPNPYSDVTSVGFTMAEAGAAKITVFDLQGKVLYETEIEAVAGLNTVNIKGNAIQGSGVMYYQLESNGFTATRKMIKM